MLPNYVITHRMHEQSVEEPKKDDTLTGVYTLLFDRQPVPYFRAIKLIQFKGAIEKFITFTLLSPVAVRVSYILN